MVGGFWPNWRCASAARRSVASAGGQFPLAAAVGHDIQNGVEAVPERQDQARGSGAAGGEGQAQFQAAEAALQIGLRGEDDDHLRVEESIEKALWKLIAVVDSACIEERLVAQICREGLGVDRAGAAGVGDEDGTGIRDETPRNGV